MSLRVMTAMYASALPHSLRLLGLTLAWFASDDGGRVYPGVARLATMCGCSERAIQVGLRQLRERGVLVIESALARTADGTVRPAGGRFKSTRYRIDLEALKTQERVKLDSPFRKPKGAVERAKGCRTAYEKGEAKRTKTVKRASPDLLENPQESGQGICESERADALSLRRAAHARERVHTHSPKTTKHKERPDSRFETFWDLYPRQQDKRSAWRAWKELAPDDDLVVKIIRAVGNQKYSSRWIADERRWVPLAAKWLRNERWKDEVPPIEGDDWAYAAALRLKFGQYKECPHEPVACESYQRCLEMLRMQIIDGVIDLAGELLREEHHVLMVGG